MATAPRARRLDGSGHAHHPQDKPPSPSPSGELATVSLVLRRKAGAKPRDLAAFCDASAPRHAPLARGAFEAAHGADPKEIEEVADFAKSHGLDVVGSDPAARSMMLRGTVGKLNAAFGVALHDYQSPHGGYRGHEGDASLPDGVADIVETVSGLDNRQVQATHYGTAAKHNSADAADPLGIAPLTPMRVAELYRFPHGAGANQTIGIFEMKTTKGAGYSAADLAATMRAFGGDLTIPTPIDVAVDGVGNTHVSDGETVLDIAVASAVAQSAKIAVYFTGGTTQSVIRALQRMIHPGAGDPRPGILSISYGFGPDDPGPHALSEREFAAIGALFQDAANLGITVLVATGDSGARVGGPSIARTSYPASEPWVVACGGTAIGRVNGATFEEFVWNEHDGATGGGISARFPPPPFQHGFHVPVHAITHKPGRGIPDLAGNASPKSGYPIVLGGKQGRTGGTSAAAPLFAGLIARINANIGKPVGFVTPELYRLSKSAFRPVCGPPGPADNSYGGTHGYAATPGWNPCAGLGSVDGHALQKALSAARA